MSRDDNKPLSEGPFDFVRGAGAEMGRKISQSGPVQAGREVIQAGKAASAAGDKRSQLNKATAHLANILTQIEKLAPLAKQGQAPEEPAQQQQNPQQQAQGQANPRWRGMGPAPAQKQAAAGGQSGMTTDKNGYQAWQFNSFMQALHGDDEVLKEGAMDFMKGAGNLMATKAREKINSYAAKGSVLGDIYQAGVNAHTNAKTQKIAEKYKQCRREASDLLKMMFKTAAEFGDNSGAELLSAARRSGGNKANRIADLIKMYGPQYGVKI